MKRTNLRLSVGHVLLGERMVMIYIRQKPQRCTLVVSLLINRLPSFCTRLSPSLTYLLPHSIGLFLASLAILCRLILLSPENLQSIQINLSIIPLQTLPGMSSQGIFFVPFQDCKGLYHYLQRSFH